MKTIEQIVKNYKSRTLDGRDISRLVKFLTEEQMTTMGMELKDEYKGKHEPIPFTRQAILEELRGDVAFGFEKALNQRGISAGLMFAVVRMWNWILKEGLEDFDEDNYAQYGLPLFKATAVQYGFNNPIGEKTGSEYEYSSDYDGE
jgi:hypothetical protein